MDYGDFEEVRKYRVERNKILSALFISQHKKVVLRNRNSTIKKNELSADIYNKLRTASVFKGLKVKIGAVFM